MCGTHGCCQIEQKVFSHLILRIQMSSSCYPVNSCTKNVIESFLLLQMLFNLLEAEIASQCWTPENYSCNHSRISSVPLHGIVLLDCDPRNNFLGINTRE